MAMPNPLGAMHMDAGSRQPLEVHQTNWARTYYTVLFLSLLIIPLLAALAMLTIHMTLRRVVNAGVALPNSAILFLRIGESGIAVISAVAGLAILALVLARQHVAATIIAGLILTATVLFTTVAQIASIAALVPLLGP